MRKIYCIAAAFVLFSFAGCGDGVDLPSLGVETDLNKIILPDNNINLVQVELKDNSVPMEKVIYILKKILPVFVRKKTWKSRGSRVIRC